MKHNPVILLHLAQQVSSRARIVIVSQEAGSDWLTKVIARHILDNMAVIPYQEANRIPAMYASVQLLLVSLTEDKGQRSVPSKALTYFSAGRPSLTVIPINNLVAKINQNSGAGFLTNPNDHVGMVHEAQLLLDEPELRQTKRDCARKWAYKQFVHVLKQAST